MIVGTAVALAGIVDFAAGMALYAKVQGWPVAGAAAAVIVAGLEWPNNCAWLRGPCSWHCCHRGW